MPGLIRISTLDSNIAAGSAVPYARFSMTATAFDKDTPEYMTDAVNCSIERIQSGIVEVTLDVAISNAVMTVYSSPVSGGGEFSAMFIDDAGWQTRYALPGSQAPDWTYDSSTGVFSISSYLIGIARSGDGENSEPFNYRNLFREMRNSTTNTEYPNPFHMHGIIFNAV